MAGWQWPFWFALIFAAASMPAVLCLPETFAPVILRQRAQRLRKAGDDVWAPIELESPGITHFVRKYLGRPLRMLCTEPIVSFSCVYLSLIYATLYLLLQAYAFIFGTSSRFTLAALTSAASYGFSAGEIGLAFLPCKLTMPSVIGLTVVVCLGTLLATPFYLGWERYLHRATCKRQSWTAHDEGQRLPLAILGGPLVTVGLFWMGWGGAQRAHWIVPMLGGVPLGLGFVLIFIALINYMADAYGVYAASALGAASIARSTFGVVLPFATQAMFHGLGVAWACSVLGFLSLGMCVIPFAFMRYGRRIRASSRLCQELRSRESTAPSAEP